MKPRELFILRYGVLGYGGGMFVIFNALHLIRLHAHGYSVRGVVTWFAVTAAVSLLMGYGFGLLLWQRMKRRRRST